MPRNTELHNKSYSYEDVPGGRDIVFHDPFTGEHLNPGKIPSSLAKQPHLRNGLNYLARIGSGARHSVTIAGAPHSSDSVFDMAELTDLIDTHDVVFLEGVGHTQHERNIVREVGEGRNIIPDTFTEDRYKTLQLAAISGRHKFVAYGDIPADGTAYESELLSWGSLARPLAEKAQSERDITVRKKLFRAALINISGNTIFREWQMLASIGNSLNAAEQQGLPMHNSLFLLGTEHTRTLPKKLDLLRVANRTTELTMLNYGASATIEDESFDFTTAVRNYRARLKT